jgi:polyisoprenoid-binding protein YceI
MYKLLIFAMLSLGPSLASAEATDWKLDKSHTHIGFMVKHMGITRVRGSFTKFEASIQADKETGQLKSLTASVEVDSIDTGNSKRDSHLLKDDFFNESDFPKSLLKLKTIKFTGKRFKAVFDVTIRETTKPIEFDGEILGIRNKNFDNSPGKRAGYTFKGVINRQDFGLRFNKIAEGVSVVSDKVTIEIDMEMSRKL